MPANQLIDQFGRKHTYLRISVTDRCNLRCVYCMPAEGLNWTKKDKLLTFEEILRIAKAFVELGITKIRLTGGEPLVRTGIEDLIEQLNLLPNIETLAMTTNGVLLKTVAKSLRRSGLKALNVSLDSLREERFNQITKRDDFKSVISGIEESIKVGFAPLKVNVVVIKGFNDDEILDFLEFVRQRPINVRFIEYMPFKDNNWKAEGVFTFAQMKELIATKYQLEPLTHEYGSVAKDYAIPGFMGTVSFITSMSDSFCSSCNRLRLTADGSMKSCLFGEAELQLRDALRSGIDDDQLKEMIISAVWQKPEAHPPAEEIAVDQMRPMIAIGG